MVRTAMLDSASAALSACVGAALVLDPELRIVIATREASALLGREPRPGTSAPKLLCGKQPSGPIAKALAEGRPVQSLIPHPGQPGSERLLMVRSLPLGAPASGSWLLLLDESATLDAGPVCFHGMWSQSARMKQLFHLLERVALSDAPILLRGETGTGKELAARAVHELSGRSSGPFRAVSCAAFPATLLESELFGHVRGAFTGAIRDNPGHFQLAHGGTLFLDEIGELPLELQAKLLRALETGTVLPVGGRQTVSVDVRVVSATHRALRAEVEAGRFRADLMFRLRVIPVFILPLRERKEDIELLSAKFLEATNPGAKHRVERVAPSALAVLQRHDWPGNVRELHNALRYAYAIGGTSVIEPTHLPPELLDPTPAARSSPPRPNETLVPREAPRAPLSPEARRIQDALERAGGNKRLAATMLGMSRVTLWRRLQALGAAR